MVTNTTSSGSLTMKRPVFSIASLMVSILFVAMACMALSRPTPLVASAVFSVAVAIFSASALLGCIRRERAGWIGMAAFGLVYLHFGYVSGNPGYPALITTAAFAEAAGRVMGASSSAIHQSFGNTYETASTSFVSRAVITGFDRYAFGQICHSLAALLFGLVGAFIGWIVADREKKPAP
jgi:hypothetical protein